MMTQKRVVITGLGVLAPNGIGKDSFWKAIESGKSGVSTISSFDTSGIPVHIAGEIKDFDPTQVLDKKIARRIDRNAQFAMTASLEAIQDSGLDLSDEQVSQRMGVILGTAVGGSVYMLDQHKIAIARNPMKVSLFSALNSFPDSCTSRIAIELGIQGPSFTVSTACSSALDAIGVSLDLLRSGKIDYALTGGTEAPLCEPVLGAFAVIKALSTNNENPTAASRPFDKARDGFVMGEGAGVLVLEEYEHAKKRGAAIYGEVLGHGMTCDAHHITAPHPDGKGAIRALEIALSASQVSADEIDVINAHGTSTSLNDKTETRVIKSVFGARAKQIPISAIKSMLGHLIGAAGSVELIASVLGMNKGVVPPTINHQTSDSECDLDYVPNEARKKNVKMLLKNSFGFGGKNSAVVIRKV
jgi:3-oxoacyl-[acyl-carrier-protein] synthase II